MIVSVYPARSYRKSPTARCWLHNSSPEVDRDASIYSPKDRFQIAHEHIHHLPFVIRRLGVNLSYQQAALCLVPLNPGGVV